ncbi:MAG: hypothetical protein KA257_00005 [Opitutaceae bacterium]|nr:hypothetical protein [Opitutaceae bacterium]
MENNPLHARLIEDARRYNPAEHTGGLLAPYRDVLLLWRAKYMSYEQIAATLTRHGLKVSSAAVGIFCRRTYTKGEILRERQRTESGAGPKPVTAATILTLTPATIPAVPGKRGPKIARDNY